VTEFCDHSNYLSRSIKSGNVIDCLSDYQFIKMVIHEGN
jgi:hypothetical protein